MYGRNFKLLDHLNEIKELKIAFQDPLDYHALQEKYPHVRFRFFFGYLWFLKNEGIVMEWWYEGGIIYDGRNRFFGRGVIKHKKGEVIECNFNRDDRSVKGTLTLPSGEKYEGTWEELIERIRPNYIDS